MDENQLRYVLRNVDDGKMSIDDALILLKNLSYNNLKYAMVDHHRSLRGSHCETIFAEGKSISQIVGIAMELVKENINVMVTRAGFDVYISLKSVYSDLKYYQKANIVVLKPRRLLTTESKILVITAGTSDIDIGEEAAITSETMGSRVERLYDVGVCGLHRIVSNKNKMDSSTVIIVVAGMDGALPSVVAGLSNKLVIAVPTSNGYGTNFLGVAPLLSMLNTCSNGIVVVNINNGYGAGYSAAIINRITNNFKSSNLEN